MSGQEKKKYESPSTKKTQVEMEEGFLRASVIPAEDESIETAGHEKGETFDAGSWSEDKGWN